MYGSYPKICPFLCTLDKPFVLSNHYKIHFYLRFTDVFLNSFTSYVSFLATHFSEYLPLQHPQPLVSSSRISKSVCFLYSMRHFWPNPKPLTNARTASQLSCTRMFLSLIFRPSCELIGAPLSFDSTLLSGKTQAGLSLIRMS